jgi:hypothetical protein
MAEQLDVDPDGAVEIAIEHARQAPAARRIWLPCPAGEFFMMLRMYQPEQRVYDGDYVVPPVERVD